MATIDPSIALQVRPATDPLESYGKAVSLKSLMNQQRAQEAQFAQMEEQQAAERKLNDLYRSNVGGDGQVNRQGILSGAASAGLGSRIPGLQKGFAEADKATADASNVQSQIGERDYGVLKKRVDATNGMFSSLLSRPGVTQQDVIQGLISLVDQGVIKDTDAATAVRQLPRDEQLRPWLMQKGLESLDAAKRLEALTPKREKIDSGKMISFADTNPLTNPNGAGLSVQRVTTPGEDQSAMTSIRGQNLTDARGREANQIKAAEVSMGGKPPPGYRWIGDGRLEAIPGGPGDKLPEKQQNQVIGTQNLGNAIREYRSQLKDYGMLSNLSPDARAAMGTKYNNMMLQAKEAYNLGVLNGPDLDILTSVITDPRSGKGMITSNKALDSQASELDRIMRGIESTSANRRPQDVRVAAPAVPAGPKKGAVQDGYVFLGGDPSNPQSWKKASK